MHAVYATLADGTISKGDEHYTYGAAVGVWTRLDDQRRAGLFPHVKHFEVRDTTDPKYAGARTFLGAFEPMDEKRRGFSSPVAAAKLAWRLWQGETTRTGKAQGHGGWFYWQNGRTAFHGANYYPHLSTHSTLTNYAVAKGLVVQGVDGRWYPHVPLLSEADRKVAA